jgi:hypothetical protein
MGEGPAKLDVVTRERAIIAYLRDLADPEAGATVREIHSALTSDGVPLYDGGPLLCDSTTRPLYYKVLQRMQLAGQVEEAAVEHDGTTRYRLSRRLHADMPVTLDDLRELAASTRPTEALAHLMEAREYVRERRDTVLRATARALQHVPPRELLHDMIGTLVEGYNADAALLDRHDADERHRGRLLQARNDIELLCVRWLGLDHKTIEVPPSSAVGEPVRLDDQRLGEALRRRVFGERCLMLVRPDAQAAGLDWRTAAVAGSDGSTYSSVMQIDTAAQFTDPAGSEVVTFNNSVAYVHAEGDAHRHLASKYYSVPLTRSAIDSPTNAGMVMAPFMYANEGLHPSDYEHMAKCATDVVQWRADHQVFLGHATALGTPPGRPSKLPRPRVHLRDGTVTLQERESHHYQRPDSYGEMVREGVRLSHEIMQHIVASKNPPVFAGATKSSQLQLFTRIVTWFIAHGCPSAGVEPVDASWDVSRGAALADNEAMTLLMASIADERDGGYFVSFAVARPFHTTTDLFRLLRSDDPGDLTARIAKRRRQHLEDPAVDSYWKTLDEVDDDPYARMLEEADYVLFYIGHTEGDPAPMLPRYEFIESLRTTSPKAAETRVDRNIRMLVAALDHTKFTVDLDHNFLTRRRLAKLIPAVIYQAHEKTKALGRQLESELKSMVLANLARLLGNAKKEPTVSFRPAELDASVNRYLAASEPDEEVEDDDGG